MFGSNRQTNRQRGRRNAERSTYNGHSGSVNFSTYIGAKLPVDFNKTYTGNIAKIPTTFFIGQGIGWLAIVFKKNHKQLQGKVLKKGYKKRSPLCLSHSGICKVSTSFFSLLHKFP